MRLFANEDKLAFLISHTFLNLTDSLYLIETTTRQLIWREKDFLTIFAIVFSTL